MIPRLPEVKSRLVLLRAQAKARVRSLLREMYLGTVAVPFLKQLADRAIVAYRARSYPHLAPAKAVEPPATDFDSPETEKFNDLQAARIVLDVAELLQFHRDKMMDIVAGLPTLSVVEACLRETGISDERIVADLHAVVAAEPAFAEAWLELGIAYADRGNFVAAEGCFDKCLSASLFLKTAPDRTRCHVQAALGKARALEAQGKLLAAADSYAAGLIANGASGIARVEYGMLLRRLGRIRESLAEFEAGMSSDVTAVALPSMPRDFSALAERLKARFGGGQISTLRPFEKDKKSDRTAVPLAEGAHAPLDKSHVRNRMRLRLITVVWGESFIDIYLRITARTLLAAGNLEALAQKYNVSYSIHTTEEDAQRLRESSLFRRMQGIVDIEIFAFDQQVVDVKNPSSHWILWRAAAEQAKQAKETVFFIIPDMIFAVDTLVRWGRRFDEGYRAVCMASPQVVLETTLTEIETRFPAGDVPISLTDGEVHDLLLRQLHPLMVAMYRDTSRPSRHSDSLLGEAEGAGLVMRVLASQPFCIDLNYFEVNNAFCPLNHLEDISYEQPYTVCLEPMLKYPDLYFRKSPRSEKRLSNMGSWIDYHLGPSDVLWASHNSRFVAAGRGNEASFRRTERAMDFLVGQMRLTGSIYRVMAAMREAGCRTAAQVLSLAHFAGRLRRHWQLRGEITVLVPAGDGDLGMPPGELEKLLTPGNENLLRQAISEHIFAGRLTFAVGDGLARPGALGASAGSLGVVRRSAPEGSVAAVIAGPIEVDDCTIYVVDRALTTLRSQSQQTLIDVHTSPSKPSILPNRWEMNPARIIGSPPKAGEAAAVQPQSRVESPTVIATLHTFLKNYFDEASKEDASRAGGLNGHLSVARMLDLEPVIADGTAAVLVSMGALYHRLHYFKEITDRYCDTIGLPKADMPVEVLIRSITKERAPLLRASDLYSAALLIEPTNARAMLGLAGVRTLEGMPDAADRLYKEAANQDPSLEGHVSLRRAAICEAMEKWSEAADLYSKAAEKLEVMGEWHENAARCLRNCGRAEEALRHYYLALDWFRLPGIEFCVTRPSTGEGKAASAAAMKP